MTIMGIDVPNNILAPLIVAVLTASFWLVWEAAMARSRKKIAAAPHVYVSVLDKLIQTAMAEGKEMAVLNARAIVATRNSLRDSMVIIGRSLNSGIDRLANDIGESKGLWEQPIEPNLDHPRVNGAQSNPPHLESESEMQAAAWETIQVLHRVWPSKKLQIEVEIRKVLAELGLLTK
jgi:hypothetical protein